MSKHENNAATVRITFNANDLLPTDAQINDLDLTDEELDSIKGGPNPGGADDGGGGGRTGGDWIINHNEMTLRDAHDLLPAEAQVTDLDLTDEELDSIKGGPNPGGADDGGGGRSGGDWIMNNNEMMLRDE
jgi:hypothetical protein